MVYKPLALALCLFVGGISFGISLGWGALVVLGLVAPPVVLGGYLLLGALRP